MGVLRSIGASSRFAQTLGVLPSGESAASLYSGGGHVPGLP